MRGRDWVGEQQQREEWHEGEEEEGSLGGPPVEGGRARPSGLLEEMGIKDLLGMRKEPRLPGCCTTLHFPLTWCGSSRQETTALKIVAQSWYKGERVTVTELMTYKHRVERERTERSVEVNERVVDDTIQKKLVYWKWGRRESAAKEGRMARERKQGL